MRSSIVLGAACALGALAVEPSYVTEWTTTTVVDWTTVTITKTLTVTPTESTTESVATQTPETQVKVQNTAPQAAAEKTTSETTSSVVPTTTTAAVATEAAETSSSSWSSTWSSSWESTWSTTEAAATTEPTSTSTSSSTEAPAATGSTYQTNVLYSHNVHRANHSSSDLTWDSDLQASAQTLAARCVYEHDTDIDGGGYGQNIGYGTTEADVGVMISNLMYNDEAGYYTDLYGEASPDMTLFEKWGHFSQIVWKGTTKVGCATVSCSSLGNVDSTSAVPFTVCNYSPPGNYDGEYADNIAKPLGLASYSA
ncbi:CAP domain-containing protein [Aspergillus californicus]